MKSSATIVTNQDNTRRRRADSILRANRKRGYAVYQLPSGCRLFVLGVGRQGVLPRGVDSGDCAADV